MRDHLSNEVLMQEQKQYPSREDVFAIIRTLPIDGVTGTNEEVIGRLLEFNLIDFPLVESVEELKAMPSHTHLLTKDLVLVTNDPDNPGTSHDDLFEEASPLRVFYVI